MKPKSHVSELTPTQVYLDWAAYFQAFCELHGKWYVLTRNVLLFPDGYTHSSTDYRGPEWPPPSDPEEARLLKVEYWTLRRGIVRDERDRLRVIIEGLEDNQRSRSALLQQLVKVLDEESGVWRQEAKPLDLEGMKMRLGWLCNDVEDCDQEIKKLEALCLVKTRAKVPLT